MKKFTATTLLLLISSFLLAGGLLFYWYAEVTTSQVTELNTLAFDQAGILVMPQLTNQTNVTEVIKGEVVSVKGVNLLTDIGSDSRNPDSPAPKRYFELELKQAGGVMRKIELTISANGTLMGHSYVCNPDCPDFLEYFSLPDDAKLNGNPAFIPMSYASISPGDFLTLVRIGEIKTHDSADIFLNDHVFIKR